MLAAFPILLLLCNIFSIFSSSFIVIRNSHCSSLLCKGRIHLKVGDGMEMILFKLEGFWSLFEALRSFVLFQYELVIQSSYNGSLQSHNGALEKKLEEQQIFLEFDLSNHSLFVSRKMQPMMKLFEWIKMHETFTKI